MNNHKEYVETIKKIYKEKTEFDVVIQDILNRLHANAKLSINSIKIRNFYTDKVKKYLLELGLNIQEVEEQFIDYDDYNRGRYTEKYWIISYDV